MDAAIKSWRISSSILLVAKTAFVPCVSNNSFNYKLLSIKRSVKSKFMPGISAFPGGSLSKADCSKDWMSLYKSFGFNSSAFDKLNLTENRPKIFDQGDSDEIPTFLSLRIAAIRETFEECGILICRSFRKNYKERFARWATFIGILLLISFISKL